MTPPASSARALHDILADVNGRITESTKTGHHAWVEVSGGQLDSMEFIEFHTEAMALMGEVIAALDTMQPASRLRFTRYVPEWWEALVQPSKAWGGDFIKIIEQSSLDMLGSLADVVEAKGGPSNPQTVEMLRRSVDQLLADVEAAHDIPFNVRAQILTDLNHIASLLNQVETFGVQHVVAEVEKVAGRVMSEAVKSPTSGLKKLAIDLTVVLALLAPITENVATIAGNVRSVFGIEAAPSPEHDIVQSTVIEMYNTVIVQRELPPGSSAPKDLPAGASDGNVVDAEVVDE